MQVTEPSIQPKKSFREIIFIMFLIALPLFIIFPSYYNPVIPSIDLQFVLLNLIIGAISFTMILIESRRSAFSLHMTHWLFQYTFFFIAPIVQYLNNRFPWGLLSSNDTKLLNSGCLVILLWHITWIITSFIVSRKSKNLDPESNFYPSLNISPFRFFALFALTIAMLIYTLSNYGFSGIFTRGATSTINIDSSSVSAILRSTGRSLSVVMLIISLYKYKYKQNRRKPWFIMTFLSVILALMMNFPSATPRFWAASVYIGLLLSFYRIKSKKSFTYILLLGLFIIFPMLGYARTAQILSEFFKNIGSGSTFLNNILSGDYDAFSMVVYTFKYIGIVGVSFGHQLLGVLLFFIPRSFWMSKPIGSGYVVSNELSLSFNNISNPLVAEGLINFGIIGVVLFAVFFSYITKKIDIIYWFKTDRNQVVVKTLYPFIIGLFFFMSRGDLLSTFSYMVSFSIPFILFIRGSNTTA